MKFACVSLRRLIMDNSSEYLHARVNDYSLNPDPSKQHEDDKLSKQRFDSGVGDMDIGMRPVSTNHRNTTYDYIDNHYEDVPSPLRMNRSVSEQSQRKSVLSGISGSSEVLSDFDDTSTAAIIKGVNKRKKYNPLYQKTELPSIKGLTDGKKSPKQENLHRRITCHSVVLIVVLTSSFAALGLSLYLMMVLESRHNETAKTLHVLQDKYNDLAAQNVVLQSAIVSAGINTSTLFSSSALHTLSNTTSAIESLKEQLSVAQKQINFTQNNLTEKLDAFNTNISQHLHDLTGIIESKDLSGFTNLSSCYYKFYSSEVVSGEREAPTMFYPSSAELESVIPMFVSCSVKGGTSHTLERRQISTNKIRYRCSCSGVVNSHPTRVCTVHLWLCPRH